MLFLQQKTNMGNEIVWKYFIFVQVVFNKMLLKNTVVRCHIFRFLFAAVETEIEVVQFVLIRVDF